MARKGPQSQKKQPLHKDIILRTVPTRQKYTSWPQQPKQISSEIDKFKDKASLDNNLFILYPKSSNEMDLDPFYHRFKKGKNMEEASNPSATFPLEEMYVVSEAATLLGVKTNRIHAMIDDQSLPSRFATRVEIAQLVIAGRIKGVPGSGIRLIPHLAVAIASSRRKRGWPKGKTRKERYSK